MRITKNSIDITPEELDKLLTVSNVLSTPIVDKIMEYCARDAACASSDFKEFADRFNFDASGNLYVRVDED